MVYTTKQCWEITTVEDQSQHLKRKETQEALCPAMRGKAGVLKTQMHWEHLRKAGFYSALPATSCDDPHTGHSLQASTD